MRSQWHAFQQSLVKTTNRQSVQAEFQAMGHEQPVLQAYRDPAVLFEYLHGRGDDHSTRNATLRALVVVAQSSGARSDAAVAILLVALWPGMDAVFRRLVRHFRDDPDRLAAEIAGRASAGIRRLDLAAVTWIAATLIRNVERDVKRMLAAEWQQTNVRAELHDDLVLPTRQGPLSGLPETTDPLVAIDRITEMLATVIGADARLVSAVAIEGHSQQDAALHLGITYDAARKRYQRAIAKLQAEFCHDFPDHCPKSGRPTAFPHQTH